MRLKANGPAPRPNLSNDTIAVVLGGWTADPPAGVPRTHGFGSGMGPLYYTRGPEGCGAGAAACWRQHEVYLRQVAAAWGWAPRHRAPDGTLAYYGEAIARGMPWDTDASDVRPDDEGD